MDRRLHRLMRDRGLDTRRPRDAEDKWVAHVNEVAYATLYPPPIPGTWAPTSRASRGSSCPISAVSALYREICNDVAAKGYEGFAMTGRRNRGRGPRRELSWGGQRSEARAHHLSQDAVKWWARGALPTLQVNPAAAGQRRDKTVGIGLVVVDVGGDAQAAEARRDVMPSPASPSTRPLRHAARETEAQDMRGAQRGSGMLTPVSRTPSAMRPVSMASAPRCSAPHSAIISMPIEAISSEMK